MERFRVGDRIFYHDWLTRRVEGMIENIEPPLMSIRLDGFNGKVSTTARFINGKWRVFRTGEEEYRDELFKISDEIPYLVQ